MKIGAELPQIILDIRAARAVNWKTATVLYDDIFGVCIFALDTFIFLTSYQFQIEI